MALLASSIDVDLTKVTPQEQLVILEVIRRDKDLRQNELDYAEQLKSQISKLVMMSLSDHGNDKFCACCGSAFWLWCFFIQGDICEGCGKKVCSKCRQPKSAYLPKVPNADQWLCLLCTKERQLRALTGAWFYQSTKFVRDYIPRIANRGNQIHPPAAFFLYFMFQDKDIVRNGINNGGKSPYDQPTLSEEEEEEDEDIDLGGDPISVIMRRNRRVGNGPRLARITFSQDTSDETFSSVVKRNEKVLNADRRETAVKKEAPKLQTTPKVSNVDVTEIEDDYHDEEAVAQYNEAIALIDNLSNQEDSTMDTEETDQVDGGVVEEETEEPSVVSVSGDICLEITYSVRFAMLSVKVESCRKLATPSRRMRTANPYVKVYLLPDKCSAGKKKTRVRPNTLDPSFEEVFNYDIKTSELAGCSLWTSVWHKSTVGKNVYLGNAVIPLDDDRIMNKGKPIWFPLVEPGEEKWKSMASFSSLAYKSTLDLSLKYISPAKPTEKPKKGELHVGVKHASGLLSTRTTDPVTSFCKLSLLPERASRQSQQHTKTVKMNTNPVWNQLFVFPGVALDDLKSTRSLEITVWHEESFAKKTLIGKVVLSPEKFSKVDKSSASSGDDSYTLWQHMLSNPNEWSSGTVNLQLENLKSGIAAMLNL